MVDDGNDRSQDGPLDRTIAILTFVCEQRKALSAAEIAAALSLPLPTAHRLIGNLESRGLIQKALGTKRYVVGDKLVTLSAKAIGSAFRTARRHAVLSAVADRIGEQCEIGAVRDNGVAYVDSVRSWQPQALQFDPGGGAPLHCTSTGKIYISRLPPKARHRLVHSLPLVRHTPKTIVDPDELLAQPEETRRRGWAKTNEEFVQGVVGCAVPIVSPAEACGMERQTLCDWVHRYNASGLDGLYNRPRRNGPLPRLSEKQQAQIAKWVEEGPDLERDGVVRWRCTDLQKRIREEFAIELHERSVGKLLRKLSFRRISVRPQHPQCEPEEQAVFKVVC